MENFQYIVIATVAVLLLVGVIVLYNRLQRLRVKVEEGYSDIDVALEKRFDLLSEQIEAVKKYLSHEYKVFSDVTAQRVGKELEEEKTAQQRELTEEAIKTIDEEISKYWESIEQVKTQLDNVSHYRGRRQHNMREHENDKLAQGERKLSEDSQKHSGSINQKLNALANAHRDLASVGAGIDALAEQYPILNSWVSMDKFQLSIVDSEEHLQAARRLYNSNVSIYNQTVVAIPWSIIAAVCGMKKADFYEIEDKKRNFSVDFN